MFLLLHQALELNIFEYDIDHIIRPEVIDTLPEKLTPELMHEVIRLLFDNKKYTIEEEMKIFEESTATDYYIRAYETILKIGGKLFKSLFMSRKLDIIINGVRNRKTYKVIDSNAMANIERYARYINLNKHLNNIIGSNRI